MEIVVEQSEMVEQAEKLTYQEPFPLSISCKRKGCAKEQATLIMLVRDGERELVKQRPQGVRVWPHDSSVIAIYLCTECGSMRARWNQG